MIRLLENFLIPISWTEILVQLRLKYMMALYYLMDAITWKRWTWTNLDLNFKRISFILALHENIKMHEWQWTINGPCSHQNCSLIFNQEIITDKLNTYIDLQNSKASRPTSSSMGECRNWRFKFTEIINSSVCLYHLVRKKTKTTNGVRMLFNCVPRSGILHFIEVTPQVIGISGCTKGT